MKKIGLLLSALLWLSAAFGQPLIPFDSLDRYFQTSLDAWGVPGMAIAIVENGQVVFAKGYGVKEAGKPGKVDEHTNFAIASNSKAFTAAALAILVDEGKLSWDDKVIDILPEFRMYHPYVTANITVRDLLCHRAGFKTFSGDLLWFETNYSRAEVIRRSQYLEPAYGFRERFGYSNIMYIVAGEVVAKTSGLSWDEFIQTRFFGPLEMNRTLTSIKNLDDKGNYATPHFKKDEAYDPIDYMCWDNVAAAGGINSNVMDLTHWIALQLGRGILDDDTFFSPRSSREMWQVLTPLPITAGSERTFPSTHFSGYGMGWQLMDYKGYKVIGHSGGTDGMTSYTALIPEKNLGFVILTNAYASLYYPMEYAILDAYLGPEGTDWSQRILERVKRNEEFEKREQETDIASRVINTSPSLPLDKYQGTYGGELYGNAKVELQGQNLKLSFEPAPRLDAILTHWHYDTFKLEFTILESLPDGKVTFILDSNGEVEEMRIDVPNPDFDFTELHFMKIK